MATRSEESQEAHTAPASSDEGSAGSGGDVGPVPVEHRDRISGKRRKLLPQDRDCDDPSLAERPPRKKRATKRATDKRDTIGVVRVST